MFPWAALWLVSCWLVALCAWVTHVVTCIKAGAYLFMIAGAIAFPIGVFHGWGIWLGVW